MNIAGLSCSITSFVSLDVLVFCRFLLGIVASYLRHHVSLGTNIEPFFFRCVKSQLGETLSPTCNVIGGKSSMEPSMERDLELH